MIELSYVRGEMIPRGCEARPRPAGNDAVAATVMGTDQAPAGASGNTLPAEDPPCTPSRVAMCLISVSTSR